MLQDVSGKDLKLDSVEALQSLSSEIQLKGNLINHAQDVYTADGEPLGMLVYIPGVSTTSDFLKPYED